MDYYSITPRSRIEIRALAKAFRQEFGIDDVLYVPIVELLDKCSLRYQGFNFEILPDSSFENNVHASINNDTGLISIRESVFERASEGAGRDRMTIAHEIGHYVIHFVENTELTITHVKPKTYRDPEWQAKCFAGELMVNYDLTKNMGVEEIEKKCGVTNDAALVQYNSFH